MKSHIKDIVNRLNGNANYNSRKVLHCELLPNALRLVQSSKINNPIRHNNGDSSNAGNNMDTFLVINSPSHINQQEITEMSNVNTEYKALENDGCKVETRLVDVEKRRNRLKAEIREPKNENSEGTSKDKSMTEIRENRLLDEIQELKEQNELLEFRLLELEYYNNSIKAERSTVEDLRGERDDISDSGVMSLSPYEDIYAESEVSDIKLDDEQQRTIGNEVQQKLFQLLHSIEDTYDKAILQQALDLIKLYQIRICGMEKTLINMFQERYRRYAEESLTGLMNSEECSITLPHRIVSRESPFTEAQFCESLTGKLFAETDRLQESGIFDELLEHELVERKSTETQTDLASTCEKNENKVKCNNGRSSSVNDGSNSIYNRCGLTDELNKLDKIKQHIEEQSPLFSSCMEINSNDCVKKFSEIALSQELSYFKKQYEFLRAKLNVFESSADLRIKRLADALKKETELQNCVQYLSQRITKLEKEVKRLEEEKCEFEEAENDSRLRAQKLEVKLCALVEKKNDLQFQLQQQLRSVSNLRNTVSELEKKKDEIHTKAYQMEIMVNELEERNFELEEREMDVRYRLQIIETIFPVLLQWNMYMLCTRFQNHCNRQLVSSKQLVLSTNPSLIDCIQSSGPNSNRCSDCGRQRECDNDTKELISSLEKRIFDQQRTITKLENDLMELRRWTKVCWPERLLTNKVEQHWSELVAQSQQFSWPTAEAYERIHIETLDQADEAISAIEYDFKSKLERMQEMILDKQWKLEQCERKVASLASSKAVGIHLVEKTQNLETEALQLKKILKTSDEEKENLMQKEKYLREEVDQLNSVIERTKQNEFELKNKLDTANNLNKEWEMEYEFKSKEYRELENKSNILVNQFQKQIVQLTRNLENCEVTNSELKEEVETLENAVCELNRELCVEKDEREKMLIRFRKDLASKQQEIDFMKRLSRDMMAVSAAQELNFCLSQTTENMNHCRAVQDVQVANQHKNTGGILPKIISSVLVNNCRLPILVQRKQKTRAVSTEYAVKCNIPTE